MLGDLAGLAPGAVGLINMLILRGLDDLGRAVSAVPSSAPLRFCIHTLSLLHARLRGLEVVRSESASKPHSANEYSGCLRNFNFPYFITGFHATRKMRF